jgi:large subunit ribosomal protein L17
LILTERDAEGEPNAPKVKGRIVTTLPKAKEVRPLVERCITIARKALPHIEAAEQLEPNAERGDNEWRAWRESPQWREWNQAIAPALAARRRALKLLGDKQAVGILFDEIAPRFADRDGGYTRVLRLAGRRLGDGGAQAILEFVGTHERKLRKAPKPAFEDQAEEPDTEPVAPQAEGQSEPEAADRAEDNAVDKEATEEKEKSDE